jgi:hypothetical protein
MPRGKYTRKTRMQSDTPGAVDAPEPTTAAPTFEDKVLDALERFSSRLDALESAGPRFVPATVETYGNANERQDAMKAAALDGVPRSRTIPIMSTGEKVPDFVMRQYPPGFGAGSRVRLNPNAVPHGRDDGKTRGELMALKGTPDGIGEVIDRTYLAGSGSWKYKCRFPPRTVTGAHGGILYLHEPELMSA